MNRQSTNQPRYKRPRSEAEKEQWRKENGEHGGWYAAMRWRREQREAREETAKPQMGNRADRITVFPRRQYDTKEE